MKIRLKTPLLWRNMYSLQAEENLRGALQQVITNFSGQDDSTPGFQIILIGASTDWDELTGVLHIAKNKGQRTICVGYYNLPLDHHKIWELLSAGADDYLPWNSLGQPEQTLIARLQRWEKVEELILHHKIEDRIIGKSKPWLAVVRQVVEAAYFSKSPILLLGESGTGKELLARIIHDIDNRPHKKDYIVTDCTTVTPELSGSELFGHEKGSFTNAIANRDGAFALADGGTLFLDEIGELPLVIQAELLRVIQEGAYKRVGSNQWKHTNFRLVAATHRNLEQEVKQHRFREDLFYRISGCICRVPPLRDRREDIIPMANFFLQQFLNTKQPIYFDEAMYYYLITREYKGNVRELQQLIARIAYRHPSDRELITVGDLPESDRPCIEKLKNPLDDEIFENTLRIAITNGIGLKDLKRIISNKAMELCIHDEKGNLQNAAQRLRISDRTIQLYHAAAKGGSSVYDIDI